MVIRSTVRKFTVDEGRRAALRLPWLLAILGICPFMKKFLTAFEHDFTGDSAR